MTGVQTCALPISEVMEEHIREHLGKGKASEEVTDDLLAIVRAYLK